MEKTTQKKLILFSLIFIFCLGLVACIDENEAESNDGNDNKWDSMKWDKGSWN